MKKIITTIIVAISLTACQFAKDKAQEGVNSALENVIENQTGQEIDLAEIDSFHDQKIEASFLYDDKEQLKSDEAFTGSVMISKTSEDLNLSFQLVNESGTSLMGVFSNFDENYKLPLVGKFSPSNSKTPGFATASLILMKLSETGMEEVPMPFEGSMTMLSMSDKEAEFEINAKGGSAQDVEKPAAWKTIVGKVKISNPPVQSMGIGKEQLFR